MTHLEQNLIEISEAYPKWDKEFDKELDKDGRYKGNKRWLVGFALATSFFIIVLGFNICDINSSSYQIVFVVFAVITASFVLFFADIEEKTKLKIVSNQNKKSKTTLYFNQVKLKNYLLDNNLNATDLVTTLDTVLAEKENTFNNLNRLEQYHMLLEVVKRERKEKNNWAVATGLWCKFWILKFLICLQHVRNYFTDKDNIILSDLIIVFFILPLYIYKVFEWFFLALYKFCNYIALFFEKKTEPENTEINPTALIPFSILTIIIVFATMMRFSSVKEIDECWHTSSVILFAFFVSICVYRIFFSTTEKTTKAIVKYATLLYCYYFWILLFKIDLEVLLPNLAKMALDMYAFFHQNSDYYQNFLKEGGKKLSKDIKPLFWGTFGISLILHLAYVIWKNVINDFLKNFSFHQASLVLQRYKRIKKDLAILARAEFIENAQKTLEK